ncbi:sigma factor-like helix-turn-helix DNA-binding protein, partial [Pseudomonas sp. SIMBA_065]
RQAFLLAQLDGLSIVQIAQQLDVSRATIERDLAKALGVCYRLRYADT